MIRDAERSDFAAIAVLFDELGVDDPPPAEAAWIADTLPHTIVFDRGGVIGYATFRTLAHAGHVHNLVVAPAARGEHIGSALMREIASRIRAGGLGEWHLNVKAENVAAIRLYEHLGMTAQYRTRALRIAWERVTALPDDPVATTASFVTPDDDHELETTFQVVAGRLDMVRRRPNRIVVQLRDAGRTPLGVAAFDPGLPGSFPFAVARPALLRRLFDAIRPYASGPSLQVVIERDVSAIQCLLDAGAESRLDLVHYRGAL